MLLILILSLLVQYIYHLRKINSTVQQGGDFNLPTIIKGIVSRD